MSKRPTCIGCKKKPEEIFEYIYNGKGLEPVEFVRQREGTYNKFAPNKFYCTTCYIKAGMPVYHHGN